MSCYVAEFYEAALALELEVVPDVGSGGHGGRSRSEQNSPKPHVVLKRSIGADCITAANIALLLICTSSIEKLYIHLFKRCVPR